MYLTAEQAKIAIGCDHNQLEKYIAAALLQPYIVTAGSIVKVNGAANLASALLYPTDRPASDKEDRYVEYYQDKAAYAITKEWHFLDWECDPNIIDMKNKPPKGVNQQRALIILEVLAELGCNRSAVALTADEIKQACELKNKPLFSGGEKYKDGWEYGSSRNLWKMAAAKIRNPQGNN